MPEEIPALPFPIVKVMPDGSVQTKPDKDNGEGRMLIKPVDYKEDGTYTQIPIPKETSMIHGVYDEDVEDAPTFKQISKSLFKMLFDCDLGGFNSNKFDIPLLAEEFLRVGIDFSVEDRNLIDVQNIFHLMEKRTLKAGYKFYCGKDLDDAHEALPDTIATYEIFAEMITKYDGKEASDLRGKVLPNFENDMEVIHKISQRTNNVDMMGRLVYNEEHVPVFNFGKYKGQAVADVLARDSGYFGWMMRGDFPLYTKKVLKEIKESLS